MFEKLNELGLDVENKIDLIEKFMQLFIEYNKKVNLISRRDVEFLFEKHIYDSLAFNLFKKKYLYNSHINLLDIGAGGGFPSVPISFFFNDIDVFAVDSTLKKIRFIEYIKNEFELKNLHPICKRAEELDIVYTQKKNFKEGKTLKQVQGDSLSEHISDLGVNLIYVLQERCRS